MLACGRSTRQEAPARASLRTSAPTLTQAASTQPLSTLPLDCFLTHGDPVYFPFGYDRATRRCTFNDDLNQNLGRFRTLSECIQVCNAIGPDVCRGMPARCQGLGSGWWFNSEMNRCEPYEYRCDVPGNNFRSLEDCRSACGGAVIAPSRGCPTQKPAGACSGDERNCLYDVTSLCRCNDYSDHCNIESGCKPNAKQVKLVQRCLETAKHEGCEAASPYMSSIPWSCSCKDERWACSRLEEGDITERQVIRDGQVAK